MYATNDNLQAVESRHRITSALLSLVNQYSYKDITISQICQEAQIVRQTYYRNFDSKDDIMKYYLDNMIKHYFEDFYQEDDVPAQLKDFFAYMLQQRELLLMASAHNLFFLINQTITLNITKFLNMQQLTSIDDSALEKYVTGFIASTICCLLSLWADNRFLETPTMMAQLAQKFLVGLKG